MIIIVLIVLLILFGGSRKTLLKAVEQGNAEAARRGRQAAKLQKQQMVMQFASYTEAQQKEVVAALKEARRKEIIKIWQNIGTFIVIAFGFLVWLLYY